VSLFCTEEPANLLPLVYNAKSIVVLIVVHRLPHATYVRTSRQQELFVVSGVHERADVALVARMRVLR
jgi:hypothetical protein